MATRTIYATIRIDLAVQGADEVTDEMVEAFVENTMYNIPGVTAPVDGKMTEIEVSDTCWEETRY